VTDVLSRIWLSRVWSGALLLAMLALCSCRRDSTSTQPAAGAIRVFVSIPPQKYFVERVGGEYVTVSVLLRPGQSPHTYDPTPKQMVELSSAQVYFRIGVPFEKQVVDKIATVLKGLEIVDTREGIDTLVVDTEEHADHGTAPDADHERHEQLGHDNEPDPHIWMNPRLVKRQARTICRALCRLAPDHSESFERNCAALEAELDHADARIAATLAPLRGRAFYVFHPAFGYFADAYGLKQVAVETGGKQPSAKQLQALIERARSAGVKLIFIQPQFTKQGAEAVAKAIGGAVVPLDPLAEDYIANLMDVASKIETALKDRRDKESD